MLRQASYGTIKIGTYQSFKRLLVERPEGEFSALDELLMCSVLLYCSLLAASWMRGETSLKKTE